MNDSFLVMGIDQSMHATGVCIVDQDHKIVISYNMKDKFKEADFKYINLTENLNFQMKMLNKTIKEFQPEAIAREGYSYGSARMQSSASIFELGEVGGAINQICYLNGYMLGTNKYYLIPPTKHKKFNLNQHHIKKDSKFLLTVYKKFNIEFATDDEADSFMIANLICDLIKLKRKMIKYSDLKDYQIEALLDEHKTNKNKNKNLEFNITLKKFLNMEDDEKEKFLL